MSMNVNRRLWEHERLVALDSLVGVTLLGPYSGLLEPVMLRMLMSRYLRKRLNPAALSIESFTKMSAWWLACHLGDNLHVVFPNRQKHSEVTEVLGLVKQQSKDVPVTINVPSTMVKPWVFIQIRTSKSNPVKANPSAPRDAHWAL